MRARGELLLSKLLHNIGGSMIPAMGRDHSQQTTPDLFSTASVGDASPSATKQVTSAQRRHVLPKDLPNAVKHLTDRELDLLIGASLEEAKRRGRLPPGVHADESSSKRSSQMGNSSRRQVEAATVPLTRGQVNAVRAAFKAGIKPSLIARQFGLSQSDVRKVLASDAATRGETR
jgi:predicted DNA binding protein